MATVLDFRPPHAEEENVFSVVAGETQYRWAIHEKKSNYFPVVCWRTSNILRSEVDSTDPCVLLSRYLPDEALGIVFGAGNTVRTKERAAAHRATLRVPAISVYVVVSNETGNEGDESAAIEFLSYIFRDVPCNFFRMQRSDFLGAECSTSLPYTNLEQVAVLKAADEMMSKRRVLLIDSGTTLKITSFEPKEIALSKKKTAADKKTGEATSEKKEQATKTGESTSEQKKAAEKKEIETTETSEDPTSQSFCLDAIRVTSECHSLSITSKLRALHENTGALPSIDTKDILQYLQPTDPDARLQLFATNTVDAMVASVVQETMLFLRNMVKSWALSHAEYARSKDTPLLLVCFTGQEGELLKTLLNPSDPESSVVLDWDVNDEDVVMEGYPEMTVGPLKGFDLLRIRRKNDSDSKAFAVEVKTERHLVHYGVQRVLGEESQKWLESMDELEKLRHEFMGCRIAKTFDSEIFRGQVMLVDSSDSEDLNSVDLDIYTIRYDDGDAEEFSASELYDHLLFYVEMGEEGEHNEAMQKAFQVKMEQSEKAAQKLALFSEAIQKRSEKMRSGKKPARGRRSKKRVFAEADHASAMLDSSVASATKQAKRSSADIKGEDTLDISDPKSFVGRKVAKFFGEDLFLGKITEYLPAVREGPAPALWTVEYDDGDQEDYEFKELLELIVLHRQYDRGELEVVEVEDDEDNMESNGV